EYAILREHFRGREKELREQPRLVLLSFGGSDPQGLTLKAARALQSLGPGVDVVAVAGPAFSFRREFETLSAALPRRVPLINEAGGHIAELMLEADVMVGSGGMSVYEIAALGTTGGAGGQGSHLAEALSARGDTVYLLDNPSTGSIENIEHLKGDRRFHYAIDSVMNEPITAELIDRVDVVYHLAAAVGVRLIVES